MPRPKCNTYRKFFAFDPILKINRCLVEENNKKCNKIIKSDHGSNLASHIKSMHKKTWSKLMQDGKEHKKNIRATSTPINHSDSTLLSLLNPQIKINMSRELLIKFCTEMCSVNGRPFSIVEDSGFRKIIDPIVQGIGETCIINRKIIKNEVLKKYNEVTAIISKEMEGKLISLKIDGLTHLNRTFLGVNAQFIEKGKIILRTLSVTELFDRHTGEYLRDVIIKILDSYNIKIEQIYSCTTDNGRNMLKCISLINELADDDTNDDYNDAPLCELDDTIDNFNFNTKCIGVRCAAHTLQLAINAVLKYQELEKVTTKARNVVKKLRTPTINILLKNQGLTKPIIDCATRWSSTFDMLSSLNDKKMKEFCLNLAQANNEFFICDEIWVKIAEIVETLRSANVATKILQKEQLTFGDAYDAWFNLKVELQKVKTSFSSNLLKQIKRKEDVLFDNDAFIGSIFLDPRWNVVLNQNLVERAIDNIVTVRHRMDVLAQNECIAVTDDDNSLNTDSSSDCVEAILKSMEKENSVIGPTNEKIRNLLKEFRKEKRISRNVNILQWWEEKRDIKPELYELSKVLLAVPATQVSVERLFSGVKFIMNPSRNRLDDDSLNAVIVLKVNKDLF